MDAKLLEGFGKFLATTKGRFVAMLFFALDLFLLAAILFPDMAKAFPPMQAGVCPPNTLQLITPEGTWRSDLTVCTFNGAYVQIKNTPDENFPCAQYIRGNPPQYLDDRLAVAFVPNDSQFYGEHLRIRFYIYGIKDPLLPAGPPPGTTIDDYPIWITYYDDQGLTTFIQKHLSDYEAYQAYYIVDNGPLPDTRVYYRVYDVNEVIFSPEGHGGVVTVFVLYPDVFPPANKRTWGMSSVRLGSASDNMPAMCEIPGDPLPPTPNPTPTPLPTWTPNPTTVGTASPTPTPYTTPDATSVGGTPPPAWTPTPISFPTIPAENTPTPWPPYTIPTVAWPTLPPTVVSGIIPTIDTSLAGIEELANTIEEEWQPAVDFGAGALDLDNGDSTGTGSPNAIIAQIAAVISTPISYVKAIQTYLPNTAPYVGFLILMASWVPFNMMAKFGLTILPRLFELIRRIIELIPGF